MIKKRKGEKGSVMPLLGSCEEERKRRGLKLGVSMKKSKT
jgi:hypothetical protein